MIFGQEHFEKFTFTREQIKKYFDSAKESLKIAESTGIPEVIFKFSYDALIKMGLTLIAFKGYRIKSRDGHHMKILQSLSVVLNDSDIEAIGNKMRRQRNMDLYDGGIMITEKQSKEYRQFVKEVMAKIVKFFTHL